MTSDFVVMKRDRIRCYRLMHEALMPVGTNGRNLQDADRERHRKACSYCADKNASIFYCYVQGDSIETAIRRALDLYPDRLNGVVYAEIVIPNVFEKRT